MAQDNIIPLPDTDRIEEEASVWVMRLSDGALSEDDKAAFARWLNESAQHKDAFDRLSEFWDGLDFVEGLADYAESDVARASVRQERAARRYRMLAPAVKGGIAASIIAICGIVAFQLLRAPASFEGAYRTAVGEQQTVDLPDGSRIILNTNSGVEVAFDGATRAIRLTRGETYFDVASDKQRPFSVATAKGVVTAVGTAFSVRLRDRTLNVVVTEGRVALRAAEPQTQNGAVLAPVPQSVELSAGQSAIVDQGVEDVSTVQPAALQKAIDWQDGELSFKGETLEQVIADIGRYTNVRIEIGDDNLRQQKIVAYYKVGDVERLFEALNVMANVQVERIDENHVRLYRAN